MMSSTATMTATEAGGTATLRPSLSSQPPPQPSSKEHDAPESSSGGSSEPDETESEEADPGIGEPVAATASSSGTSTSPEKNASESANSNKRSKTQELSGSEAPAAEAATAAAVNESDGSNIPEKTANESTDSSKRSNAQEPNKLVEASSGGAEAAVNVSASSNSPKKMPSSSSTNTTKASAAAKRIKIPKKKKNESSSTNSKRSKANPGIEVILPNQAETEALQVLELLDSQLNDRALKKSMSHWVVFTKKENGELSQQVPGVRDIQNGRFEIFVQAGTEDQRKPTDAFDAIVGGMLETHRTNERAAVLHDRSVDDVRHILIRYASQQARADPRIQCHDYVFDNFSLLVNYGECDAQYPHIDLLAPNVQCGCVLTDKSPATVAYRVPEPLRTVADLKRSVWRDMPGSLETALERSEGIAQLLSQFGDCLHPGRVELPPPPCSSSSSNNARKTQNPSLYPRGTVLTLPGSVMHAGPRCAKYRCILFFSGWRRGSAVAGYNPDIQYFAPVLVADFITILFDQLSVSDRLYLTERLAFLAAPYKNLYRHLTDETMIKFTRALAWAQYGMGGKEELMKHFAEGKGVVPKGAILTPTKQQRQEPELKLVSEDDLHTTWEGAPYAIQIFRVVDDPNKNRVQIYYPADSSWEGKSNSKIYTLVMDGGKSGIRTTRRSKFDGSNGTLRDDEGNEIVCFRQP